MGLISFFKDIFSTDYTVDNSKVYFTPFGISDVDESLRKKEFSTDKLKVLSIVEINKHTDIYSLIYAVNLCNMEGMNIELDFFEMGNISKRDLKKLENELKRLNCSNIHFKGSIQNERETVHLYPKYDVYASVYYSVDSRLFTVEAMRAGLPLILLNVGGNECFVDGDNGYLIKPFDINDKNNPKNRFGEDIDTTIMDYRCSFKELLEDHNKLISFGEESRELYKEQYSSNLMVESTINMYKEVLSDNG